MNEFDDDEFEKINLTKHTMSKHKIQETGLFDDAEI